MFIAVMSDIHDNLANLEKCLAWCRRREVGKIICCGDITTIETIHYLAGNFAGEILVARGNLEIYEPDEMAGYKNIIYYGEIGLVKIAGLKIGFCHEPRKISPVMTTAAGGKAAANEDTTLKKETAENPDFIFYGHTHKPWVEKRGKIIVANPGNLANTFYAPTFAVLDTETKKLELKILAEL
jgi:hypothetical protein